MEIGVEGGYSAKDARTYEKSATSGELRSTRNFIGFAMITVQLFLVTGKFPQGLSNAFRHNWFPLLFV